jgi:hypothetical protein
MQAHVHQQTDDVFDRKMSITCEIRGFYAVFLKFLLAIRDERAKIIVGFRDEGAS